MSSPTWQMTQKVGSPEGFKTNAEYDDAWAGLHKINEEMYGEKNIYGGRGPNRNRLPDAPQQPQPNTPSPTGKAPDMSVYTPGKAQPTQTQSQGTPYGQLPPTGSPATSYADAWNAAMPKGGNGVTFTPARSVIGAGAGNMAYAQPDQRPQGFVTQSYDLQGNPVAQGQQAQQRDAFIAQILQTPRETPQYDFQGMLGKAGDMVKDGWQNPFNFNQQSQVSGFPAPPVADMGPAGQRYVPVPPVSDTDPTAQMRNAGRFVSDLERTNPNTWTDQQWSDYEAASRDTLIADAGGYYRRDGKVYQSFGNAMGPDGNIRRGELVAPEQPPAQKPVTVANPGGQPMSPGVQGRPDNRMAIQDLFTKNNIQAPQGFLDQLIGLLGGNAPPTQMPPMPVADPGRAGGAAVEKYTPAEQAAQNIIQSMNRTNPTAWSPQQWAEYEQAYRDRRHGATLGGPLYRRGASGQIFDHTYGSTGEQYDPNAKRFMGRAFRSDGTEIDMSAPLRPPVANPVTATPTPPKQYGTPPPPPPPQVLTDADVAAQEAEIRRLKGLDWARANPNNWFMNPYMQDNPRVREVRSRNPTVNKSGKGGGGSSNRKFTNVNGKMKWT